MLPIYIPSHKRPHVQTAAELPDWVEVIIIVYPEEYKEYVQLGSQRIKSRNVRYVVVPEDWGRGIWVKSRFIMHHASLLGHDKIMIMDDDLTFAARRGDDPTKFRPMRDHDWFNLMWDADLMLGQFLHGAIACREGGNRNTEEYMHNTRAIRAVLLRPHDISKAGVQYRDGFMQDFDLTLQLLNKGHPNVVLNQWVQNQKGSNTEGGCSETRTPEVHEESALRMKARWPDYVTLVQKTTKSSWGGGTRTDVRIAWKKCYNDGVEQQ